MKSKKAETYLNRVYKGDPKVKAYNREMVEKAIDIAINDILIDVKNKTIAIMTKEEAEKLSKSQILDIINESMCDYENQ